ncbi:ABC transporter ATP-binding protein [Actinoplanes sp. CA-142083]|uniref:ABC transporter ATP-binding protein n=1 Tax=Actinoplanes sp. CA-142083 TaxID=3239903 RepID=UPI003D9091E5
MTLLDAHGLHKSFGPIPALRGIDLEVAAGEVLAVMGPSGSGKSTLLYCLAGILTPDAGEVTFDGRRVDLMPDAERARLRRTQCGFVFQFGQLVPELPVRENIALPLLLAGQRRRPALATAASWEERLGLHGCADRLPGEISGGQAQRVALARALIASPRVVFADEPTGSLDSVAADEVMELLVTTAKSCEVSVVLVTHEPRVAAYADRQVTVRDGTTAPAAVTS